MGFANIEDVTPYSSYILNEGDILMSHINSMKFLGRAVEYSKIGNEQIIHGMNLLKLVPTKDIISSFMIYQFQTSFFRNQIATISHQSVNQASFNITNLKCLKLIVPPLSEQQRIVSRLDSAFAHIDELKANAEKQVNEARALFQKALSKAMEPKEGWEEKKFGDVCSYHKEQGHYKDMRYIGMEHMESGTGKLLNTISSDAVLSSSFKFNKGEVLYGRLRPYLRKVYIAEFDGCCSTEVFPIRSKTIKSGFIKYWLLSDEITNRINETSAGCRMPRGNMNEVKNFPFFYPKDQDQQRIVSRLDALSEHVKALEENQRKVMAECDALKQALLRKVFE